MEQSADMGQAADMGLAADMAQAASVEIQRVRPQESESIIMKAAHAVRGIVVHMIYLP